MAEIEKRPVKIVETVLRDAHQSLSLIHIWLQNAWRNHISAVWLRM